MQAEAHLSHLHSKSKIPALKLSSELQESLLLLWSKLDVSQRQIINLRGLLLLVSENGYALKENQNHPLMPLPLASIEKVLNFGKKGAAEILYPTS